MRRRFSKTHRSDTRASASNQVKTVAKWKLSPSQGSASTAQVRAACRGQPGRQVALAASRPGPDLIKDVEPNWSCQHLLDRARLGGGGEGGRRGGRVGGRRQCCSARRHSAVTLRRGRRGAGVGWGGGAEGHMPKKTEKSVKEWRQMETKERPFPSARHLVERRPMEQTV